MSSLEYAAELLARSRRVVVFTGAGVSAESGVPTYRSGSDGLWSQQNMQRFANPPGYAANLPDSYEWYRARAQTASSVSPNPAHDAISAMSAKLESITIVTQNIDSLHQRAGSSDVVELHGHLRTARCDRCSARVAWSDAPPEPRCAKCGGMLRPDVVMFGEMLPEDAYLRAVHAALTCDVLFSIGTSNQVYPAAQIPAIALAEGAFVVIVNPEMDGQPAHPRVIPLVGRAGEIMPKLVALAWPSREDMA